MTGVAGVRWNMVTKADVVRLCERWLKEPSQHHIVTLNPEMVVEAQVRPDFKTALSRADLSTPDGSGLVWAAEYLKSTDTSPWKSLVRFLGNEQQRAVPGIEILQELAGLCADSGDMLFVVGANAASNFRAQAALKSMFPQLQVDGISGGEKTLGGPESLLQVIRAARPAVLAVAYGAPIQTLWIDRHLRSLPSVKIAIGVGGALDILAGVTPRAPQKLQDLHLEWLWRFWLQPKRWRRIGRATMRFIQLVQTDKQKLPIAGKPY